MNSWNSVKETVRKTWYELWHPQSAEPYYRDQLLDLYYGSGFAEKIDPDVLYDLAVVTSKEVIKWHM